MTMPPYVADMLGAAALAVVPAAFIVGSAWLSHRARKFASARWVAEDDARRRDAHQSALAWSGLYEATERRINALERRVSKLESGNEDSSRDLTALCARVSVVDKIERSLRKRGLLVDSTKPGQIP